MHEYGIWDSKEERILPFPPLTRNQARIWIREFYDRGGRENRYEIASRKVSPWYHGPTPRR